MYSPMMKLCGLWENQMKNGEMMLNGKLTYTTQLLILPNSHKKEDLHPDFYAFIVKHEDRKKKNEQF